MAMLRTRAAAADRTPVRLLYSSRTEADIIYRDEINRQLAPVTVSRSSTR
jgi:ferredoxin-NADP reductase